MNEATTIINEASTLIDSRNSMMNKPNVLRNGLSHWGDVNGIARRMKALANSIKNVQDEIDFKIALAETMAS